MEIPIRILEDIKISNFKSIVLKYIHVDAATVEDFISELEELLKEVSLNSVSYSMPLKMILEFIDLLKFQAKDDQTLINQSLIKTITETRFSLQAVKDISKLNYLKDTFNVTHEEFLWTCVKNIVEEDVYEELQNLGTYKGFGCKLPMKYDRIMAYLVSVNRNPNEFKMKCLLKISDTNKLIICAKKYGLLQHLIEYCKENNESQLKKIQQALVYYKN